MKTKFFITFALMISLFIFFVLSDFNLKNTFNKYIDISEFEKGSVPGEEWFQSQRAFPFDEIPNDAHLKSMEYVKNHMTVYETDNASAWSLTGPTNVEGRITTIAIHPFNAQIVYAGTANGGLWKSTDFCQTWNSVFDNQNTSSIGAVAIDHLNPEIIYCGTGEANSLRSYYAGTGLYKSTDGGNSWTMIGLDSSYCIGNIAVNPVNSQEIFVAAGGWTRRNNDQRGIYRSTNGGTSWVRSFFIADSVSAIDVAIDPSNPSKIFAAMWERVRREDYIKYGGIKSGLHVSTNSGNNWSQVAGGFPFNDVNLGRISFDISKSNSQMIYALTATTSGVTRGLYKSINGGVNWTQVSASAAGSSNYAWFNRICKVDPTNPQRVFCGGLEMEYSNNGGTSFSIAGTSHLDQHSVTFAPSNQNYIVVGNDGGVDYSTDGGISWSESNSLPITQFYAGEIDYNNPNTILGGSQDNGTYRTNGTVAGWEQIYGGDGFYCLVDYTNPQRIYASSQMGGLGVSDNGGSSFSGGTSGLDLTYTNWMTPFVMDKNNPLTLYCGTYKIHKTTNGMQSWTAISPDLTNGHVRNLGTITTVDVSKSNPNVIYCGTDDANVWVTTNGGTNWTKVNAGLPYRWVTRVVVHPDSANICYVALSGYKVDSTGSHIFRTTNFGASWTSIKGNLPDAPINDIIIDPSNTNTLIIATDITVMYTRNLGAQWFILSTGIPSNVPCHDLTFHDPTRTLIAWTHGRSAFKTIVPLVNINESGSQIISSYILYQNYPNPFNPNTIIKFEIVPDPNIESHDVNLTIYNSQGKEAAVLMNENKSAGRYEINFNGDKFPSGIYFYTLKTNNFTQTKRMILLK